MGTLEIQVGNPPEDGRYIVYTPCEARSAAEYCEPSIATWHGGKWHFYHPVWAWIGPLPVVHGDDCTKKFIESACRHERTMSATTGDGLKIVRCSDCGEILHMDPVPFERDPVYSVEGPVPQCGVCYSDPCTCGKQEYDL